MDDHFLGFPGSFPCPNAVSCPPITPAVATVIVSRNRLDELCKALDCIRNQSCSTGMIVIDSSDDKAVFDYVSACGAICLRSEVNLGGAGSFALGLLQALATGAEWIWLMDDDGRPQGPETLRILLEEAQRDQLDAIAPVVLDADDPSRFAFPYPVGGRYVFHRAALAADAFIPSTAHLFNGLLLRAEVVFRVGLPDLRMFIRGDEVDFMLRMRKSGVRFGTTAKAAFLHPSSDQELHPVFNGRLHVVYPSTGWKRRCQYRNRAYNDMKHRRFLLLLADLIRYPYFFILVRRFDFAGLAEWFRCTTAGWRGHIKPEATAYRPPAAPDLSIP